MARSYWMWMGENWESLSATGVIQMRPCLTELPHLEMSSARPPWPGPVAEYLSSECCELQIFVPDLPLFLPNHVHLLLALLSCLTTQTQAEKEQITELSLEPCDCYLHILNNCVLEGTISQMLFFSDVSSCHPEMVPQRGGLEEQEKGKSCQNTSTKALEKDTFLSDKHVRGYAFPW